MLDHQKVVAVSCMLAVGIFWLLKKLIQYWAATFTDAPKYKLRRLDRRLQTHVDPPVLPAKTTSVENPFIALVGRGRVSRDELVQAVNDQFKALTSARGDTDPRRTDVEQTVHQLYELYTHLQGLAPDNDQCRDVIIVMLVLCFTYGITRGGFIPYAIAEYVSKSDAFDLCEFISDIFYLSDDSTTRVDIYDFVLFHSRSLKFDVTAWYSIDSQAASFTSRNIETSLVNLPKLVSHRNGGWVSTALKVAQAGSESLHVVRLLRRYGALDKPMIPPSLGREQEHGDQSWK